MKITAATLIPIALGAAAVVSCCVCCIGGLADALPAPYAIGFAVAAAVFTLAAAYFGAWRARRPFRAVRTTVVGYLDDIQAGNDESARRWLTNHARTVKNPAELTVLREHAPSAMTAYRINNIHISNDDFEYIAQVTVTLFFDDGSNSPLWLQLFPADGGWKIEFNPGGAAMW